MESHDPSLAGTVTLLLRRVRNGEPAALDDLFREVYEELRCLAQRVIASNRSGARALGGTELVNSACARLLGNQQLDAEDRRHFYFIFGRAMHDVLVETVRHEMALKRGGAQQRVPLVEFSTDGTSINLDVIELNKALVELEAHDPDGAQIIRLRFYSGRTLQECAGLMGCTFAIARRNWEYARAWLSERLSR